MTPALYQYQYRLVTCSTVILSPREHQAFYLAAGDFSQEMIVDSTVDKTSEETVDETTAGSNINIIYPFYQYGTYSRYEPRTAQYYIPGSSIKGALKMKTASANTTSKLMVDDIRLRNDDIRLSHLYKLQYKSPDKNESAYIASFFPNIAVEMLQAGVSYTGDIFSDQEREGLIRYLQQADQTTKKKLNQLTKKIDQQYDHLNSKEDCLIMRSVKENIQQIVNLDTDGKGHYLLLIGGYKGNILAAEWDNENIESAIYLDIKHRLPHGLIKVMLE